MTRTERRYRGDTLVLETTFVTPDGVVRLVDAMDPDADRPHLARVVEGITGRVPMNMELVLRPDYGQIVPWVYQEGDALHAVAGPDAFRLSTPVETRGVDRRTVANFEVAAGDQVPFVLEWHRGHDDQWFDV